MYMYYQYETAIITVVVVRERLLVQHHSLTRHSVDSDMKLEVATLAPDASALNSPP